jgi:ubiquitin-conjugating enzyme E2 D/E
MIPKEKLQTMKYVKAEFNALQTDPILSLGCTVGLPEPNNILHWKISLVGPQDTPYAGGMFFLTADFPIGYPKIKPEIRFINKIYHLNVREKDGHICISTLNQWVPETPMVDVISAIFALFYEQNPFSPYSLSMAGQYKLNRNEF